MGGFGSGRWVGHRKATAVESCRWLNLGALTRPGGPRPGRAGTLTWSRGETVVASVGYEVVAGPAVRLSYTWTPRDTPTAAPPVALDIRLVSSAVPRGGVRWWGLCPLAVAGVACRLRVGKLYLPPGSHLFGCRHCHRLTYRARQSHDARVSRLAKNPDTLFRMAEDLRGMSVTQLGLMLSALTLLRTRLDRDMQRFDKKYGRD